MKFYRIALLILVLVLVLTGPAAAQSPQPPTDQAGEQHSTPNLPTSAPAAAAPASPNIDLGQPRAVFGYTRSTGISVTPYLIDSQHLNAPNGLFIDTNNSLYVVEEDGYRVLKYSCLLYTSDAADE